MIEVIEVVEVIEVIEVVRAIIIGQKRFWLPSIVLPLGVFENLAENTPTEVNCL